MSIILKSLLHISYIFLYNFFYTDKNQHTFTKYTLNRYYFCTISIICLLNLNNYFVINCLLTWSFSKRFSYLYYLKNFKLSYLSTIFNLMFILFYVGFFISYVSLLICKHQVSSFLFHLRYNIYVTVSIRWVLSFFFFVLFS